jgi:thiamine biosynthesis lipoprotein
MVLNESSSMPGVLERVRRSAQASATDGFHKLTFQAMNTHCRVHFRAIDPRLAQGLQQEVLQWVAWFEARYSRFIPDSLISRINAAAGEHWVEIDRETEALLQLCQDMHFLTRGVFDPTATPLLRLWNWKAQPPVLPAAAAVKDALELVGLRKVERRPGAVFLPRAGMSLDLGGIGKEYAVDRVLTLALERGVTNLLVDLGQDIRVHGEPPEKGAWHIGLEDPLRPGQCWTGVAVNNHAVATSGDYVRNFTIGGRRYGHIMDPRDGYPVNNGCLAVSVIAPYCTLAGILSTTAFVLGARDGLEVLRAVPGVEGAITSANGRVHTPKFYAYATS